MFAQTIPVSDNASAETSSASSTTVSISDGRHRQTFFLPKHPEMLPAVFFRCCVLLITGVLSVTLDFSAQARDPNVVIIFCDDLGYGDLACFGHPSIATPHLDRMAAEGQKWTEFYVAACVCTPSRAALQTGRYPIRSGMCSDKRRVLFPDSNGGLPSSEITIAEVLKKKGYATHAIGKWHLGHLPRFLPTKQGYDSYFGVPYSNDMDVVASAPQDNFERTFNPRIEYWNVPLIQDDQIIERPANQHTLTKRYTERAGELIRQHRDEPFFIYLAHSMPHIPLFVSQEFTDVSRRGLYGNVIEEIDWSVGRILQTLRDEALVKDTLVIFSSDNGPWLTFREHGGSAGPLRDGKGSTWEGGMREPTIFWWPERIVPSVVRELGSTLDLLPTIAEIANAKVLGHPTLDGFDLTSVLFRNQPSPRTNMFYYHGTQVFAVRSSEFKAHFMTKTSYVGQKSPEVHSPPLLYHLRHDPSEKHNVADQHPEIIEEMIRLRTLHQASVQPVVNQLEL